MRHLPAIDGLRAVAVIAVVAYHAGLIPAGFVGVDVFFVISGFLITRLLADELTLHRRIDFFHFYARRARRILPAALVVVIATLVMTYALLPSGRREVAESAAASGLFGANFYFESVTGGYWAANAGTLPLLHLWSLSVEEQFYVVWPLVLIVARKHAAKSLAVLMLASLALAEWLMWYDPQAAFYQMPARAWELAAGGLVALHPLAQLRRFAWVGLGIVLASCIVPLGHFPGAGALPAVAGSALLLAAIDQGERIPVLELRPVVYIGLISYSLYLWHWPLLAIDRALRVGEAPLTVRLGLCAFALVLSALSYRYVETPFRRSSGPPRRAVFIGVISLLTLSGVTFALASGEPPNPLPVPLTASQRCHPWGPGITAQLQPGRCVTNAPKVVLWGDSYAGAWEPFALSLAQMHGMAAVSFIIPGCPVVIGVEVPRNTPRASRYCAAKSAETLAYLRKYGADTVIVTAHWARLLRERPDGGAGMLAWAKGLPNVRRIFVVGATPELHDSVEHCTELGLSCDIPRAEFEAASKPTQQVMHEMSRLPNVRVLNLGDWLCDSRICPGTRNGKPLYAIDSHHVSASAVADYSAGILRHELDLSATMRTEPPGSSSTMKPPAPATSR